jgi:hypothetical protein
MPQATIKKIKINTIYITHPLLGFSRDKHGTYKRN